MVQRNFSAPRFISLPSVLPFLRYRVSSSQHFCGLFFQGMWQHFGVAELGLLKEFAVVNTELEFEEPHSHTTLTSSEFVLQAKLSIDGLRALGLFIVLERQLSSKVQNVLETITPSNRKTT